MRASSIGIRRTWRALFSAGLVTIALAPRAFAELPPAALQDTWIEVRSPHFRIVTNAGDRAGASACRRLEQLCAFFAATRPDLRPFPTLPTDVYLFRGAGVFDHYRVSSMENVAGFFSPRRGFNLMVMNADVDGDEFDKVLCHEYTHCFNFSNFAELPVWLNEGIAEYFGSFRPRGGRAEIGRNRDYLTAWVNTHPLLDFDLLFAVNTASDLYRKDNDLRRMVYAQGWLTVHYLSADPDRSKRFGTFLEAMRRGKTPSVAFASVYPRPEWQSLLDQVKEYARANFIQSRETAFTDPTSVTTGYAARTLSTSEALAELGALVFELGPDRRGEAEEHLRESVRLDVAAARSWAMLGRAADAGGDSAEAEKDYARAIALSGGATPEARMEIALGSLERAERLGRTARETDAVNAAGVARGRCVSWLEAAPEHPEARAAVGECDLVLGRAGTATVHLLEAAADALPMRGDIGMQLQAARMHAALVAGAPAAAATPSDASSPPPSPAAASPAATLGSGATGPGAAADDSTAAHARAAMTAYDEKRWDDAIVEHRWLAAHAQRPNDAAFEAKVIDQIRTAAALAHAQAEARANRPAAARDSARVALGLAADEDEKESIRSYLASIETRMEIQRAHELAQAGRIPEARSRLVALLKTPLSDELRSYVQKLVDQLDASRAKR